MERSLVDLADASEDRGLTPFHVVIAGPLDATLTAVVMDAVADVESRLRAGDRSATTAERRQLLTMLVPPDHLPAAPVRTTSSVSRGPRSRRSTGFVTVSVLALRSVEVGAAAAAALLGLGRRARRRIPSSADRRHADR